MGDIERDPGPAAARPALKEWLREELRDFALVAAYLWICFFLLMLYKSAVLREAGVHFLPLGFAIGKALILAKFLLLSRRAAKYTRHARTLAGDIALQSLLCLLLLLALTAVEEVIVGWARGHSIVQTIAEQGRRSPFETIIECLLLLLVLVPLVTLKVYSRIVGPGAVRALLVRSASNGPG